MRAVREIVCSYGYLCYLISFIKFILEGACITLVVLVLLFFIPTTAYSAKNDLIIAL